MIGARLGDLTWPDLHGRRPVVVVPIGSVEQHGPHLPLDTDTRIAVELAERVVLTRSDLVLAPPVAFGSSGEHAAFAGTLSIGADALAAVLVELGRSADRFGGIVFVNGHGGNAGVVHDATTVLRAEGRRALAWSPRVPGGDAHAGRTETSMLLAIDPGSVRTDRLEPGDPTPLVDLVDRLRTEGVGAVSANGILGDPRGATIDEGHRLLDDLTTQLATAIADEFDHDREGDRTGDPR